MSRTGVSGIHLVFPTGWEDPQHPSGGNYYDQRIADGLRDAGWDVHVATAPARAAPGDRHIAGTLAKIPDGAHVLVDGLIAFPAAAQLAPHLHRLHLTVLMHMPPITAFGGQSAATAASGAAVLTSAAAIVVTSDWCRQQLLARYDPTPERVHVARPGVDHCAAATAEASADPRVASEIHARGEGPTRPRVRLLCVGVLAPHKGQDVLIDALSRLDSSGTLRALDWSCVLVGADDVDPIFAATLRRRVTRAGLGHRVRFAGVLDRAALCRAYLASGLLITPSRAESYGMVVTEALAHGLPILASDVGGLPEALGQAPDGSRPGQLVPAEDPDALAGALARWCCDDSFRAALRTAARGCSSRLSTWDRTVDVVLGVLASQE